MDGARWVLEHPPMKDFGCGGVSSRELLALSSPVHDRRA
jgi:hypothetical protein